MKKFKSTSTRVLDRLNQSMMMTTVTFTPTFVKRCEPYAKAIKFHRMIGTSRSNLIQILKTHGVTNITQNDLVKWEAMNS